MAALLLAIASTPLSAQRSPRERADSLTQIVIALETPDSDPDRLRLWFMILAEWNEEGARAVLAGDRDRLDYAADQEGVVLPLVYFWFGRVCPDRSVPLVGSTASYLAYALAGRG